MSRMPWRKDRPYRSGELPFHLYGAPRDEQPPEHSPDWYKHRMERIESRHNRRAT